MSNWAGEQRVIGAAALGITGVLIGSVLAATRVQAASGGDPNAGTIKVSNVGDQPTDDHDPQLSCVNIDIWGSDLADASGTFAIDGWPPSGSQEVDYSGTWSYDTSAGGLQVIAVVPVTTLMANATAKGDVAASRGFHFKVELTQDPAKAKTFWLDCGPVGSSSSSSSDTTATTATTTGSVSGISVSATSSSTVSGGVAGIVATNPASTGVVASPGPTVPSTGAGASYGAALLLAGGGLVILRRSRPRRDR